uniref:Seven TM Receptor n=1 Tax=Caenorhabditis tropicalis TaxID=1561998 RepID=A0A1I7TUG1_9PELO
MTSVIISRIQRGCTCFGMLSNVILIQLIWYNSPKSLGVYKYLMIYIASFELIFAFLELVTVPDMFSNDSAFFVIIDPRKTMLAEGFCQMAALIFCGAFAVSLAIFGVQFAYRYFVLTGNTSMTSKSYILLWLGSPLLFAGVWTASCAVFLTRNQFVDTVLREEVLPSLGYLEIDRLAFVGVLFFPRDGSVNWDSVYGMILCSCVLASTEFIMFFFAIKSYLATRRLMGSLKLKRLQWQLFYAIVSQASIPILFMQIPITAIYISTLFNSSSPIFDQVQAVTVSFYLATDALPTIFIVKAYREVLLDYCRCIQIKIVWPRKRIEADSSGAPT